MTDQEIILKLIDRDPIVTQNFFFDRYDLFHTAYKKIIPIDDRLSFIYDDLVIELYNYLMVNDAKKLGKFNFSISLDEWLQKQAELFFSDKWIVQKLIDHKKQDEKIITDFFLIHCKPLFQSIIKKVFDYPVNYNEIVNEIFIHLIENDAKRLKTFKFEDSFYGWLKIVVIHYFLNKKNHDKVIDIGSEESPSKKMEENSRPEPMTEERMDVERLLAAMPCERYAKVIRKLILEDMSPDALAKEMSITKANLYNIKKRAIQQLTQVAIKDIKNYNK